MEYVIFIAGSCFFTLTVVFALLKRSKPQPKQDHPQTPSNGLNEGLGGLKCNSQSTAGEGGLDDCCSLCDDRAWSEYFPSVSREKEIEELKKINDTLNNLIVSYPDEIRLYEITSPYSPSFTSLVMALPNGQVRELYYSMTGNLSEFEYKFNPKDIVTYIGSLEC